MPVTWSDEKLILLYCPGRGLNSRPPAHRSVNMIKVSYDTLRANHSATAAVLYWKIITIENMTLIFLILLFVSVILTVHVTDTWVCIMYLYVIIMYFEYGPSLFSVVGLK